MDNNTDWIASAQYFADEEGVNECIQVTDISGHVLSVPMSNGNRHYEAVLAWVAEGNTIAEAE